MSMRSTTCHYNCTNTNYVFLVFKALHRNELNIEYIRTHLFCSSECLHRFKKECISEDENGCEYYNEISNSKYDFCYFQMKEKVDNYKKQRLLIKHSQVNGEPPMKLARVN